MPYWITFIWLADPLNVRSFIGLLDFIQNHAYSTLSRQSEKLAQPGNSPPYKQALNIYHGHSKICEVKKNKYACMAPMGRIEEPNWVNEEIKRILHKKDTKNIYKKATKTATQTFENHLQNCLIYRNVIKYQELKCWIK